MAAYDFEADSTPQAAGIAVLAMAEITAPGDHTIDFPPDLNLAGQANPVMLQSGWVIEGLEYEADLADDLVITMERMFVATTPDVELLNSTDASYKPSDVVLGGLRVGPSYRLRIATTTGVSVKALLTARRDR